MAHLPGKFVWFELNTKDLEKAKRFYGELFGWKINTTSMNGFDYRLITNGEIPLGGLLPQESGHPHWISYLSVADVDQTLKQVKKNGGKVISEANDFPGVGRFAQIADPQGGRLYAFHSEKEDPADREAQSGDWYWNELLTTDAEKAVAFYRDTFGVQSEAMEMPGMKYHVLKTNGVSRGGIMTAPDPSIPTSWLPYVRVGDVDAIAKRAKKLGGEVMMEPQDIPTVGRYAVLKDPDGAAIAVITPAPRG